MTSPLFYCYIRGKFMLLRSFGTHDGTFHADEVTACSLLLVFDCIDRDKIVRSRDLAVLQKCEYVCDVGGVYDPLQKRFDHHQVDYVGALSSAGMVLKFLRDSGVIDKALYTFLNGSLVVGVDAHDNGKTLSEEGVCTFSHVVSLFVPPDYNVSAIEVESSFFEAVDFVSAHLRRVLERYSYIQKSRERVIEAMAPRKNFLLFEEALPWMDVFFELGGEHHPALFLVMPTGSHWKVRGIPPDTHDRMKVRHPLPEAWAGLMDADLKKVSGISGAIFCHKGRFISVWETKEDAMKALEYVLKEKK